jgi:hypothetical protein
MMPMLYAALVWATLRASKLVTLTIHEEIVIRHVFSKGNSSPSIVTEVENSGFDSEPAQIVNLILDKSKVRKLSSFPMMKRTIAGIEPRPQTCVCRNSRILAHRINCHIKIGLPYVFPLAGNPTVMITMRPEWKSRPDSVLYN